MGLLNWFFGRKNIKKDGPPIVMRILKKFVRREVYPGKVVYIPAANQVYDDSPDFATSMMVAAATDDMMCGIAAGGDVAGAMLGVALAEETQAVDSDTSCDSSCCDCSCD